MNHIRKNVTLPLKKCRHIIELLSKFNERLMRFKLSLQEFFSSLISSLLLERYIF